MPYYNLVFPYYLCQWLDGVCLVYVFSVIIYAFWRKRLSGEPEATNTLATYLPKVALAIAITQSIFVAIDWINRLNLEIGVSVLIPYLKILPTVLIIYLTLFSKRKETYNVLLASALLIVLQPVVVYFDFALGWYTNIPEEAVYFTYFNEYASFPFSLTTLMLPLILITMALRTK